MQVQWHREACPTGTGHCLSSLSNGPKQIDPLGAKHIFRVLNIFRIDVAERIHDTEQYPIFYFLDDIPLRMLHLLHLLFVYSRMDVLAPTSSVKHLNIFFRSFLCFQGGFSTTNPCFPPKNSHPVIKHGLLENKPFRSTNFQARNLCLVWGFQSDPPCLMTPKVIPFITISHRYSPLMAFNHQLIGIDCHQPWLTITSHY